MDNFLTMCLLLLDELMKVPSWSVVGMKRWFEGTLFFVFFLLLLMKFLYFFLSIFLLFFDSLSNVFLSFFVLIYPLIFFLFGLLQECL